MVITCDYKGPVKMSKMHILKIPPNNLMLTCEDPSWAESGYIEEIGARATSRICFESLMEVDLLMI